MTKEKKVASLGAAMTSRERVAGEEDTQFYLFADGAPESLMHLFMEHYEVRDVDYETFSGACDIVAELYADAPGIAADAAEEEAEQRASDTASVYNAARLAYLNIWNQDEVGEIVREHGCDVATGAAVWYERRVAEAARLIVGWVNATD